MDTLYRDYKIAYLSLKGGMIDENRSLQIHEIEADPSKLLPPLGIRRELYKKKVKSWNEIYNENTKFMWTFDISKSTVSYQKWHECTPGIKSNYYICRPITVVYELTCTDEKMKNLIDIPIESNVFKVLDMNPNQPYVFVPIIDMFGVHVNLFENIFSDPVQDKLIDPIITQWLTSIAKKEIRDENILSKLDIQPVRSGQPAIYWHNPDKYCILIPKIKIHICVKREFLFWTFHKLLSNYNRFVEIDANGSLKSKYSTLKMIANFVGTGYLEEYMDRYPNIGKNTNNYELGGKVYKIEQIFEASFVMYPCMTYNSYENRSNVREIIKILLELFPDNLDIGSNKYPRFNFKINNCIYIGFGEGNDKEDVSEDKTFTEPLEYKAIDCNADEENECMGYNKTSKYASATQLCTYDDDKKCTVNPIMSKHKLVFKETPIELLVDGKQLNSVENIYDYIDVFVPL